MNPRVISFLLFSVLIATFYSCKNNEKDLFSFDRRTTSNFTIPSTTPLNSQVVFVTGNIKSVMDGVYADYNTNSNHIFSAELNTLVLSITSPAGSNVTFLDSIGAYITSSGQDTTYVGKIAYVPESAGSEIMLDMTYIDVKKHLLQDSFKVIIQTSLDKVISNDYTIDTDLRFVGDGERT